MDKKTAVVTGASRGIGRGIAEALAENGYSVVVNYLKSEEAARRVADGLKSRGFEAEAFAADVSKEADAAALMDFCARRYGGADVLVNNAAIAQIKLFTDLTVKDWDDMMNVTLKGVFNCSKAALRYMLPKKSGTIINVSSIWGIAGASCEVHYSAAKAGVIGFTKALAKELAPSGIQVNCVAPGIIETDMLSGFTEAERRDMAESIPAGRIGTPREVADCVLFLASAASRYITGQIISPNGGLVM